MCVISKEINSMKSTGRNDWVNLFAPPIEDESYDPLLNIVKRCQCVASRLCTVWRSCPEFGCHGIIWGTPLDSIVVLTIFFRLFDRMRQKYEHKIDNVKILC